MEEWACISLYFSYLGVLITRVELKRSLVGGACCLVLFQVSLRVALAHVIHGNTRILRDRSAKLQFSFLKLRLVEELHAKLVMDHAHTRLDLLRPWKHAQRVMIICECLE